MKRVVVTGMGIVSSLGNNIKEVLASLQALKSGIRFQPVYQEMGLRSQVEGTINLDPKDHISRKACCTMGDLPQLTTPRNWYSARAAACVCWRWCRAGLLWTGRGGRAGCQPANCTVLPCRY